jgi:hypothetical protein
MESGKENELVIARSTVLALIESYVTQMLILRKTLLLVFISGVILAPVSIVLSVYILIHPSLDEIMDRQDNFGEVLVLLLTAVFISSVLWFGLSLKQYISIGQWNRRYKQYLRDHAVFESQLLQRYGLTETEQ